MKRKLKIGDLICWTEKYENDKANRVGVVLKQREDLFQVYWIDRSDSQYNRSLWYEYELDRNVSLLSDLCEN